MYYSLICKIFYNIYVYFSIEDEGSQIMTEYLYGVYMDKLGELNEILMEKFINVESGPVNAKLQKMGHIRQMVC